MEIITRSQAKQQGLVRYFTGKSCVHGHTTERFTSTGQCTACIKIQCMAWHRNNRDILNASQRRRAASKPKPPKVERPKQPKTVIERKYRLKKKGFPNANITIECLKPEPGVAAAIYAYVKRREISAMRKAYRENNKERMKQLWKDWYQKNKVSALEKASMRRACQMMATPAWLNREQRAMISNAYFRASDLKAETGIVHHVDHIVPLKNKHVCGLHVPWNLRVVTAHENLSKSNKLIDELI